MNRKVSFCAAVTACALASPLWAGDVLDANLIKIQSSKTYGEVAFIKTDKSKATVPGCQTNLSWDFVMPLTSEHDKKLYAIVLAARTSQMPVSLNGTGTCDHFASVESLLGITW